MAAKKVPVADNEGTDGAGKVAEVIEGGEIKELQPLQSDPLQRAATTRTLAYLLVGILFGSVVIHYAMIAILVTTDRVASTADLDTIFTTWLPVISGLAGSAVTYYFTQDK